MENMPLITLSDVENIIKTFKNNTLGESQINKLVLNELKNTVLINLQYIVYYSILLGCFPDVIKKAILKFNPKANTC